MNFLTLDEDLTVDEWVEISEALQESYELVWDMDQIENTGKEDE